MPSHALADGAAVARWLDDVLTAVGAERAHLVGSSYGGWTALEHARHLPGRVSAVTLVDPAGLADLTGRFYRWVILGGLSVLTAGSMAPHARPRAGQRDAGRG